MDLGRKGHLNGPKASMQTRVSGRETKSAVCPDRNHRADVMWADEQGDVRMAPHSILQ